MSRDNLAGPEGDRVIENEPMPPSPDPGLCAHCRHGRRIESGKGSVFWKCEEADRDSSLRRYPQLPVKSCPAFREAG